MSWSRCWWPYSWLPRRLAPQGQASAKKTTEGEAAEIVSYGKKAPGWVFYPFALLSFLGGAILLVQSLRWLLTGGWYAVPLWRALGWLGVYWAPLAESPSGVGVSRILYWVLDLPAALCSIVVGVLWHLVSLEISHRLRP